MNKRNKYLIMNETTEQVLLRQNIKLMNNYISKITAVRRDAELKQKSIERAKREKQMRKLEEEQMRLCRARLFEAKSKARNRRMCTQLKNSKMNENDIKRINLFILDVESRFYNVCNNMNVFQAQQINSLKAKLAKYKTELVSKYIRYEKINEVKRDIELKQLSFNLAQSERKLYNDRAEEMLILRNRVAEERRKIKAEKVLFNNEDQCSNVIKDEIEFVDEFEEMYRNKIIKEEPCDSDEINSLA